MRGMGLRVLRVLAFVLLVAGVGVLCLVTKYSVRDPDIWWHLKVGDWIIQHGAVPHTGIFSYTAATRPWVAYSWGYEVLLSRAYAWFGLLGIGWFGLSLTLAVAAALFWMLLRLSGRFWVAWVLCIFTCFAFLFNIAPRPVFFSMALFAITLTLILQAQRKKQVQLLHWLPAIFVLWANLHIQFIYGLFLVGLFVGINLLQRLAESMNIAPGFLLAPTLPPVPLLAIFAACLLASCVGPYSFHLYQVVLEYSKAKVPYSMISELLALSFTTYSHFMVVLLAAGAFYAVGWQQKLDPFKLALLIITAVVAFRTTRDAWFICIPAAALIADFPETESSHDQSASLAERAGVALTIVVLLLLIARHTDFNARTLSRTISGKFPVDAVNFLRRNPAPGPLYNGVGWGGFLIWYMPQYPVAIDGRNDLYGDELDARFYATEKGEQSYIEDPYVNNAGFLILNAHVPLAGVLSLDRRFRAIYRDNISVVFVRE